jgi:hypothetical protein
MSTIEPTEKPSFGHRLQSVSRQTLYLLLIICASVPAFLTLTVPGEPVQAAVDFYKELKKLKEGDTVLLESDWTKSTRGESMGHMEAVLRFLMRRKVKIAYYSAADAQAPQVATDTIVSINESEKAGYKAGVDYVNLGFFPNAEGFNQSLGVDLRKAFGTRKVNGVPAVDTPVLKGITKIEQVPYLIVITASASINIAIERLNDKVKMLGMVTGVMVPETQVFYASKQLKGMAGGLKGVYDLENLMEKDFPGKINKGKASLYYPTLHVVLTLMILAVVAGNVGMYLSRRRAA